MMVRRWHKQPARCVVCDSCFFQVEISIHKHRSHVLKSKLGSMNGQALCTGCGTKYGITNPGKKDFKLLTPTGWDPDQANYRELAGEWGRLSADEKFARRIR